MGPQGKATRKAKMLRKRIADGLKIQELQAKGASCATCRHFRQGFTVREYCDLQTDFYGYAVTTANGLCSDWSSKP